jgi:hypothetical protein
MVKWIKTLLERKLRGSYVKIAINLKCIGRYDFATNFFGKIK